MSGQIFKIDNMSSVLTLVSRYKLVGVYFKNSGFVIQISNLCGLFWVGFGVFLLLCSVVVFIVGWLTSFKLFSATPACLYLKNQEMCKL